MSEDRKRILTMLAEGKVTADEADRLLDALSRTPAALPRSGATVGHNAAPKYFRVEVDAHDDDDGPTKVNVRIPMQLLRAGVRLSAVEHCPHLPDAPLAEFRLDCDCRKPRPGMLLRAAAALDIDLPSSILVGDRATDIQAGRSAGVGRCWLVRSGVALSQSDIELADGVFDDLAACVRQLSA